MSNTGKGHSGTITIASNDYAQAFTTGSSVSGYDFDSDVLDLGNAATGSGTLTFTVLNDASGDPSSTVLYTLTNPTSIQGDTPNTFTAPANVSLDGDSIVIGGSDLQRRLRWPKLVENEHFQRSRFLQRGWLVHQHRVQTRQ